MGYIMHGLIFHLKTTEAFGHYYLCMNGVVKGIGLPSPIAAE
jgi:hypothetical protein